MRLIRPWLLMRLIYPGALFRLTSDKKEVCLTFDDSPDPVSTPPVLSILKQHDVKAVFFCTGRKAEKYPGLISEIKSMGHIIGNHGYDHIDGWQSSLKDYCNDVMKASALTSGKIFRPPYGHIRINQYRYLIRKYKIIFWDIMPYDFDTGLRPSESYHILKSKLRNGSIIVLHDTERSNLKDLLGVFIENTLNEGYSFVLPFEE